MPEFIDETAARPRGYQRSRPSRRFGVAAFALGGALAIALAWSGGTAVAQSVCVVCEAPEQSYSCSYAPLEAGASAVGRGERALQMRCITELAKLYGHAQCKVNANSFGACAGAVHMLREEAGTAAEAASGAPAPQEPARPVAPEDGSAKTADGAPKTVVEMARRAAGATQEQIEQSGATVEDAMRQTWRCVTSLFARCSEAENTPAGEGQ